MIKEFFKKLTFGAAVIAIAAVLGVTTVAFADRSWSPPDQSGHAGQFLQTDGENTLWATPGGGGGVTSLNSLTGALNLVEGAGIDITTSGSDITISAIGANVPSDTSLAVKVATTAALPGTPTYNNGTSGVGATLTRSSNGTTGTIDGVTAANLMAGDHILVKNQAAQLQNGVYVITQQGTASLPYILTRVPEADTTAELDDLVVTAASGSTNKGVPYGQQTNNPTIGSSNIVFTATGIYMRQQTSGTQVIDQIPTYTGTALTLAKGTSNFKYNPLTDLFTIRGVGYTFPSNNGDPSQVLTTDGSGNLSWETVGGGSPAGSDTWVQFNSSGSFGASPDFTFDPIEKTFLVGDFSGTQNHTWFGLADSESIAIINGLLNVIPAHTTTPVYTPSGSPGLDNITVDGSSYSGTGTTSYLVTIDGINKDYVNFSTASISGSGFQVGETITSTSGGSATIDAINLNSNNSYENLVLSSVTGTFLEFDVITGGTSSTTATLDSDLGQQDTYSWTDGTNSGANVICKTPSGTRISNDVFVNFDTGTGHTLSDQWTFDGVPASTTYGKMLELDGYNKEFSFGDVDGISGGDKLYIKQEPDKQVFEAYFSKDFSLIHATDNSTVLNIDANNSNMSVSLDSRVEFRTSNSYKYLLLDKQNNIYQIGDIDGVNNNTKTTIDDLTKAITLQSNGTFTFQNPATTVFMNIDTVNSTAQFGGQSWASGLFADNTLGITKIGDWSSSYNETKIVVNDIEKTNTIVGGIVTPVLQEVDYGTTTTVSRGVVSVMTSNIGTGTTTLNLDGTYDIGQEFQIFDRGYGASGNNIVVDAGTGNVIITKGIAPAQTLTIATDGQSIIIKKVSTTEWMLVASN